MNPFVVNYFLSVFSFFLSENTFKKTMFWFFKHWRTAFSSFLCVTFSFLSSATILEWTKGRKGWILRAEATKGLNRMRRHFSPLPSQSPGRWASHRQLAHPQFPAQPDQVLLSSSMFPAQKPLTGNGCLSGTLSTVGLHLCCPFSNFSSPFLSVTPLISWWLILYKIILLCFSSWFIRKRIRKSGLTSKTSILILYLKPDKWLEIWSEESLLKFQLYLTNLL